MKPELCGQKVEELTTRLSLLDTEIRSLEGRRKQLELPAIDHDTPGALIDNFGKELAEGTNPQKKHLIGLLVKKVLVHSRDRIEVWYNVPNPQRFEYCNIWLFGRYSLRNVLRFFGDF